MAVEYDIPGKLRRFLKILDAVRPPSETLSLEQIKKARKPFPIDFLANWALGTPIDLEEVVDRTIPMRDGVEIPIRIYRPNREANLPIILNYHGGGWVLGNLQQADPFCRKVAKGVGAIVISVDYRLAPENKFPIPVQDCYDAFLWAHTEAESLRGDPERMAVMGDSAGGNLSAAVSLMARDLNGPSIALQGLIYPACNGKLDYPSVQLHVHAPILSQAAVYCFLEHYKDKPDDHLHPYFSPYLAESLKGLPPALVLTAGYDPLVDDGRMYAERLKSEGNVVKYVEYEKEIHGFISFANHSERNEEAVNLLISEMSAAFVLKKEGVIAG